MVTEVLVDARRSATDDLMSGEWPPACLIRKRKTKKPLPLQCVTDKCLRVSQTEQDVRQAAAQTQKLVSRSGSSFPLLQFHILVL